MNEKALTDGSVESASEWLCKGGPCLEAGDRCEVLSEDCCPCVLSGNLLIRQRDEIEELQDCQKNQDAIIDRQYDDNAKLTVQIEQQAKFIKDLRRCAIDFLTYPSSSLARDALETIVKELSATTKNTEYAAPVANVRDEGREDESTAPTSNTESGKDNDE